MPFAVGDRVECVEPYQHIEKGQQGIVFGVLNTEEGELKGVTTNTGVAWSTHSNASHSGLEGEITAGYAYYLPEKCLKKFANCQLRPEE